MKSSRVWRCCFLVTRGTLSGTIRISRTAQVQGFGKGGSSTVRVAGVLQHRPQIGATHIQAALPNPFHPATPALCKSACAMMPLPKAARLTSCFPPLYPTLPPLPPCPPHLCLCDRVLPQGCTFDILPPSPLSHAFPLAPLLLLPLTSALCHATISFPKPTILTSCLPSSPCLPWPNTPSPLPVQSCPSSR